MRTRYYGMFFQDLVGMVAINVATCLPSATLCLICLLCSPCLLSLEFASTDGQTKTHEGVENCHISPLVGTRFSPAWRWHISEAKTLLCEGFLTCMMTCDSLSS
jgi:hypothetical protein